MSNNIFDSKHWYNYVDINLLLTNISNNKYYICDSTSLDSNHFKKTIELACKKLKNVTDSIIAVAIPINIGYNDGNNYQGSHWTGLVLKLNSENEIECLFADSMDIPIDDFIFKNLEIFGIKIVKNLSVKQQNNSHDCGPWTVFNLDSLAKSGKLNPNLNDNDICNQRLMLQSLVKNSDEIKLLDIPDFENSKGFYQNGNYINKSEDIENIKNILEFINKYESHQSELRETLIKIGETAAQIRYNDKGDQESRFIRNRYGYIQRNKGKLVNKNGIYFEKLYQLSVVLKSTIFSKVSKKDFDDLGKELANLKLKISHILKQENYIDSNKFDSDFTVSILNLIKFTNRYYDMLTIGIIRDELDKLESIDFNCKNDRYYFARVFCIIGEGLNELIEDKSIDFNKRVLVGIKNVIELRVKIVHYHKIIRDGVVGLNEQINNIILTIKHHLNLIILNDGINNNYDHIEEFITETKSLVNNFKEKSKKVNVSRESEKCKNIKKKKERTSEEIEIILEKLISKACNIIETHFGDVKSHENKSDMKSMEQKLRNLNTEYQNYLGKLNLVNREIYPASLNISDKDIIIKRSLRILTEPVSQKKLVNTKINDKGKSFKSKLHLIQEEVEYLLSLMDSPIYQRKIFLIYQHIMLVIGQLMRDIEDLKICENPVEKVSPYFDEFTSSQLLREGKILSKESRNKGLAHNFWSFNEKNFFEGLKDILCIFPHLESFSSIIEKDDLPISVKMLHNLGVSFSEIGLYNEAAEYITMAIERMNEHPNEIKVVNEDISAINYRNVFGIERPVYRIYHDLAIFLIITKRFKEAYKILVEIKEKINISALEHCGDLELRKSVNNVFCDLGYCLSGESQYEESISILEQAEKIEEDFITKLKLAQMYFLNHNYDKAKKLSEIILKNDPEIVGKFSALELLLSISFNTTDVENKIREITKYIAEMEIILQLDIRSFKSTYRDKYLLLGKLPLIYFQCEWLVERTYPDSKDGILEERFDFIKLKEVECEFIDILNKLDDKLKGFEKITLIYMKLCSCYCCIFNETNIHLDKNGENLNKARKYFDLALEHNERFSTINKQIVVEYAVALSTAYNNCAMLKAEDLEIKTCIEYLLKALELQEAYEIDKITTLNNLGLQYFYQANQYFTIIHNNDRSELVSVALDNYEEAVRYFQWKLKEQDKLEIDASIIETKAKLAFCYHGISILKLDILSMKEVINNFEDLLKWPMNEETKLTINKNKTITELLLKGLKSVLNEILNPVLGQYLLSCGTPFAVKFCDKKFNIKIINDKGYVKWKYDGEIPFNILKRQIQEEIYKTSDEYILLYKFRKILMDREIN